jgi:Family of unknown function (DUF6491)
MLDDRVTPHLYYDRCAFSSVPCFAGLACAGSVVVVQPLRSSQRIVMNYRPRSIVGALTLLSAACAGGAHNVKDEELLQQYLKYAGAPIGYFAYLGPYDDWRSLSSTQLLVWTNLTDAYLLTVREPCINLRFAHRIGLSSTSGTVTAWLDYVLVEHEQCQITEIRPLDYKKMRADLRKRRQ